MTRESFHDLSPNLAYAATRDGHFTTVNTHLSECLGFEVEELVTKPITAFIHPDDVDAFTDVMAKLDSSGPVRGFKNRYLTRDGAEKHLLWSAVLDPVDELIHATGTDISAYVSRQDELESRNIKLRRRALYEHVTSSVFQIIAACTVEERSLEKAITHIGSALSFEPLLVYLLNEWDERLHLHSSYPPQRASHTESFALGEGLIGRAAAEERLIVQMNPPKASESSYHMAFAVPLKAGNATLGVLAGVPSEPLAPEDHDLLVVLAERLCVAVRFEERLATLRTRTEQLHQQARRIERQNLAIHKANQVRSHILANMSHELRTPLNAIIGFSELMKEGLMGELAPAQLDYITEIHTSGTDLLSLIDDIINIAKIDSGKLKLELDDIVLADVLESSLLQVQQAARQKNIRITSVMDEVPELFHGDARKIRLILVGLLSNAVKFTEPGGSIQLHTQRIDDGVIIKVSDTGIGVSPEDIKRIFQPFEQVDSGITRRHQGAGLGLALVKRLTELHGGQITVESTLDEGSHFSVSLPFQKSNNQLDNNNILALDYRPDALKRTRQWIRSSGRSPTVASSLDEAVTQLQDPLPSAVVIDPTISESEISTPLVEHVTSTGVPILNVCTMDHDAEPEHIVAQIARLAASRGRESGLDVMLAGTTSHPSQSLVGALKQAGHFTTQVFSIEDALHVLASGGHDVLVVNRFIDGRAGFDLVHKLHVLDHIPTCLCVVLTSADVQDTTVNK